MQASQLTAINKAKTILSQCGCFQGPIGPIGPQGTPGEPGRSLLFYSDNVNTNPNIAGIDPSVYGLFIGADGSIWVSEPSTQIYNAFTTSQFNGTVRTITKQFDGKILVGGDFTLYGSTSCNYIARLNSDGSYDSTFSIGTAFNARVRAIAVQNDGKILVGGDFTTYQGTTYNYLIRLNSTGLVDSTFNLGTGPENIVNTIVLQVDQKILIGGEFDDYNLNSSGKIARLTSAGFYDTSFDTEFLGFNNTVYTIALQVDGSMYVGGDFTDYDGATYSKIARLTTDGLIDASFSVDAGFNNSVYYIRILNNLNILVTGAFTLYKTVPNNRIIELTYNGSIASTTYGSGFNNSVRKSVVELSGNYLIGGDFTTYNSSNTNYITRLNSNGTVSTNYPFPTTTFNGSIYDIFVENPSNYLVGGNFTTYNGSSANYITRLVENPYVWINTSNNLFTNISTTSLFTSTVTGLATAGYISSSQLFSTVTGIGSASGISQSVVNSTIIGLGTFNYISSSQLISTVEGISNITNIPSSLIGLGTLGYISTTQLTSTVTGFITGPRTMIIQTFMF
jgi:uncharacterized delta-60 repeat protein